MKKFLFVLIVLLLVSVAIPVLASTDGVDLSSMSLEELLGLRNDVDEEIRTRTAQPSAALYNGIYIVGENIKPGRYLLTVIQPVIEEKSDLGYVNGDLTTLLSTVDYADLYIVTSNGEKGSVNLHAGESIILELNNGTTLTISNVISATLTEVPQASYAP